MTGALAETARRLLPRTPNADIYGGHLQFAMAVDAANQNFLTIKLWGSDASVGQWFVLECEGKEIGWRHGGDNQYISFNTGVSWFPNGFVYVTVALPKSLTLGKSAVKLRLRSLGSISYYATQASGYFNSYQKLMNAPSLSVYKAYTSTNGLVNVSGEMQGTGPDLGTIRKVETEATVLANWKTAVNNRVANRLAAAPNTVNWNDMLFLAEAYGVTWTAAYRNTAVIDKVLAVGDEIVKAYAAAPTTYMGAQGNESWGGPLGSMGRAVALVWPQLQPKMGAIMAYGGPLGTVTRTSGWATTLRASVDWGRFNRRNGFGNQEIACDGHIYGANLGVLTIDPAQALLDTEAKRYLYEAAGLKPFMNNDQPGGGSVPVAGTPPYGPNWFVTTTKGTTKEQGWVSGDYGEQGQEIYLFGQMAKDDTLKARGLAMLRARAGFRFRGLDSNGFPVMYVTEPIGVRNTNLPGHVAYITRGAIQQLALGGLGATAIGTDLLGYLQQEMADGQLLRAIAIDDAGAPGAAYVPDEYAAFKAQPPTGVMLPTTPGQPDWAWADEENMVVAAIHGSEQLYVNMLWHSAEAIYGLAKVWSITPSLSRLAELYVDDVRYKASGKTFAPGPAIEQFPWATPPDNPINALSGVTFPVGMRSDLAAAPATNRDGGRGTGYTLSYGNWLLAINADHAATYSVNLPTGVTSAMDLVSHVVMTGPTVVLPPKTSVVFYLTPP
ncbi:MAG: hypothetical protein M3O50_01190 [Myxococcota bacterium]|nr:hypothetical protein [Myxococcota bacterium]